MCQAYFHIEYEAYLRVKQTNAYLLEFLTQHQYDQHQR